MQWSGGLTRRARTGARVLVVLALGLVPGVAVGATGPTTGPAPEASMAEASVSGAGCGREWGEPELIGTLPSKLLEVSGFVSSARYPGVAWMIRDSDSPHSLYSFELGAGGPRWREFSVRGVSNHDWEDLAYTVGDDGRGRLWILENGVETGRKEIYEVLEPDPATPGPVSVENTYRVEYRNGNRNTETLFALGGRLAVVTKASPNRVYRLPATLSTARTNWLEDAGRLDVGSFLTMMAVSADERTLATVNTGDTVVAFEAPDGGGNLDAFVGPDPVFRTNMVKSQREAGDFFPYDSCDIVLVSEDSTVWRLGNPRSITPQQLPGPAPVAPGTPPEPEPAPPVVSEPSPAGAPAGASAGTGRTGYWMAGSDGSVYAFGDARDLGRPAARLGPVTAVDLEPSPSGDGYWVVDRAGRVHTFGDATQLGDLAAALRPGESVSSLSATLSGAGYWIFTSQGRVFPVGDAVSYGDLAATSLNGPVLDSIVTPSGRGYYMVASDGGIFAFGDALFRGSMGGTPLNAPVQSLVPDPDGTGYWLVASDGGVFAFEAPFLGSLGGQRLNRPITGMVAFGNGYLMVGEDGGVFNFSDRAFLGSLGATPPAAPIVSVAVVD
ncbi:MAG: hypothetical protein ACRDZ3_13925 [Acidimicrobiia bacterium]